MALCPDGSSWQRMLDGTATAQERSSFRSHLDECGDCRRRFETFADQETLDGHSQSGAERDHARSQTLMPASDTPVTQRGIAATSAREDRVSGVFGNYVLLNEIARGGMGVVYRARQTTLNRVVALKMISCGELASREEVERFLGEARAAANLQHPNIVAIHEIGEQDGRHYFSMDFVEGASLAERIQEAPLPAMTAARYMATVAEAMHFAHSKNIIHRDLKPSNILIDRSDQPRVTDFGLAKRLDTDSELTGVGVVIGSPSYMSPEQASGGQRKVSAASDIYSMGATLYALLTGRPPFRAESAVQTLIQVTHSECVPPRLLNPAIPRSLEVICLKCLEKDAERRYRTAGDLAEDLRRFLAHQPILARPASWFERAGKWCRRKPALAAVLAMLFLSVTLGAAGVVTQWRRAESALVEARQQRDRARESVVEAIRARNISETDLQHAMDAIDEYFVRISQNDLLNVAGMMPLRRELLTESTVLYEKLYSAHQEVHVANHLSHVYQYLANINTDLGLPEQALAANLRSLELRQVSAAALPDSHAQLSALAVSYRNTGQSLERMGRSEEAATMFQEGDLLAKRLLRDHPEVLKYHVYSVISDELTAGMFARQGDLTTAVLRCRSGIAQLEAFAEAHPDPAVFDHNLRHDYAIAHNIYVTLADLQIQVERTGCDRHAADGRGQLAAASVGQPRRVRSFAIDGGNAESNRPMVPGLRATQRSTRRSGIRAVADGRRGSRQPGRSRIRSRLGGHTSGTSVAGQLRRSVARTPLIGQPRRSAGDG
ncbi:MAG: protein kinase [Planctomycetaceae bacterium]